MRHFLKETDFSKDEVKSIFKLAYELKANRGNEEPDTLKGQTWAMLFSKSSTRTRVSFEVGVNELGGTPMFLESRNMQMGRGETIADTARVMARYVHGMVIRTGAHEIVEEFAKNSDKPIVNALTDYLHPCQIYTDAFTIAEKLTSDKDKLVDSLEGKKIVYYGDCANNMANSWILGGALLGMKVVLSGPQEYAPTTDIDKDLEAAGLEKNYEFSTDALEAAKDADVIYTDVWVSMGQEGEEQDRFKTMQAYQVTKEIMNAAKEGAYFMHCLPAHTGEEVTKEVYESKASIVFDEAENRLHVQKAIMSHLV